MSNTGKKILITGATGRVGSALLEQLDSSTVEVRALTHDESKGRFLRDQGIEPVVGDLSNPETLGPALEEVNTVFLITPDVPEKASLGINLIEVAKGSGNRPRIVVVSVTKASREAQSRLSRQHGEIEETLISSGLSYTILRPHFFMQNTMMAAQTVASEGNIYMPFAEGRPGMIDIRDIGEVGAKVITEDGHEGKTYTLTGPASISFHDVAAALSQALGKKVDYLNVPLETAKESMLGMGFSEWRADAVGEYAKAYSEGYGDFITDDVERLSDHPATSYQKFANDFAEVFGGKRSG